MACVLVHIEADGDRPTPAALSALGDARRIATSLGATVYAAVVVPSAERTRRGFARLPTVPPVPSGGSTPAPGRAPGAELPPPETDLPDALVAALGKGGADKVVMVTAPAARPDEPMPSVWAAVGPALAAACDELRPALIVFPASSAGADVAPRLAARLGAAFAAHAVVETGPRGEVVFSRTVYGGGFRRRLALDDLDRAAVVTVAPGHAPARGGDDVELLVFDLGAARDTRVEAIVEPRPGRDGAPAPASDDAAIAAQLDGARVIVVGGAGVPAAAWPLLEALAAALGGALGATRGACERGLAPAAREIGLGARTVAPVLYVACGASGSAGHLGAVSPDAEIVAIDRDPDAPIFRAATYGMVGAVEDLVPQLLDALAAGAPLPRAAAAAAEVEP